MTIKIEWFDGQQGYWDHGLLMAALTDLWRPPGVGFQWEQVETGGNVLVVAGRGYATPERFAAIQEAIDRLDWCLLIVMSDEENVFPWRRLKLPARSRVWLQNPRPGTSEGADRYLGCGWPQETDTLGRTYCGIDPEWTHGFRGQVNHPERGAMLDAFVHEGGYVHRTDGFGQGLVREDYLAEMGNTRAPLAPAGPVTADTFRCHEALELGRVPIASRRAHHDPDSWDFWKVVYGDVPFPTLSDWSELSAILDTFRVRDAWIRAANRTWAWWMNEKRRLVHDLHDAVAALSLTAPDVSDSSVSNLITVLIPTSPVPGNPSIDHLAEVIESVRAQPELAEAEIIVMCDGVREEQRHLLDAYEQATRELLVRCQTDWPNVLPIVFDHHTHQADMTRKALDKVRTPCILFVEHDTPLLKRPVEWTELVRGVLDEAEDMKMVRLHYDESIHAEHWPLMLDVEPVLVHGVPVVRTVQWSQRPHLAGAAYYRDMISKHFRPGALTMIEDRVHGLVQSAYEKRGDKGWAEWGTVVYAPGFPDQMRRSGHLDARGEESKFEDSFRW